jgi:hypothetical protein
MSMINSINYSLNEDQIVAIRNIIEQNYTIINPSLIYGICKPASHIVYYIKELYDYIRTVSDIHLQSLYEYRRLIDEKKVCEMLKN